MNIMVSQIICSLTGFNSFLATTETHLGLVIPLTKKARNADNVPMPRRVKEME